jgi:hypothetical protein
VRAPSGSDPAASRGAVIESGCLGMQPQLGGKSHLRLNIGKRPIANKYREGKMKRTLKRELKVLEIAGREANGCLVCVPVVVGRLAGLPLQLGSLASVGNGGRTRAGCSKLPADATAIAKATRVRHCGGP